MIQFNLLPSVKAEYIKAQRTQRTVMVASCLVTAISVFVLILLLAINAFQKHNLNSLIAQVKQDSSKLEQTPNLNQILTVQNQLESLPALHNQKPVVSRLLGSGGQYGFLGQITPSQVTISSINTAFAAHTISISGNAPSLDVINTYVDTLKFTTYSTTDGKVKNVSAFSNVILSSFGISGSSASYSITFSFDPNIFSETEAVTLTVPNIITTRSILDEPGASSATSSGGANGSSLFKSGN